MSTASSAIQIAEIGGKGRGLKATRVVPAGEVVFAVKPLILVPALSHLATVCSNCFKIGEPRACTRCHAAYYCDAACQRAHWGAIHKLECRPLGRAFAAYESMMPTPARMLLQALVKDDIGAALEGLVGHEDKCRAKKDEWENYELLAKAVCEYTGKGDAQVARAAELICKMQMNTFHRYDADVQDAGVCLDPTLAMANHSCLPNAMIHFMGRYAVLIALQTINVGEEVEISYIDFNAPLFERRERLQSYYFQCRCRRCEEDLNVYQVCASSASAPLNAVLSVAPEIASGQGQNPTPGAVEKVSMNDQYKDILQQLSESTALAAAGDAAAQTKRLATLKKCFRRCKPLVARNLWALPPMQEVLHEIPISYVERDDTEAAVAAACLIATECVPYLLPAPFTSQRVKNLFMIAGCLTSTAGDVQAEAKGAAAGDSVREKLREEFRTIDQVSLCQMLLLMVLRLTPAPYRHEWDVSIRAKDILEDINQLQGRENELTLITAWATNPQADRSQEFFQYAVVQPVRRLAALGKELIEKEFS